jgi:hypothetical protein
MGHYDDCRPGYCGRCGAGPGNMRGEGGKCEFCFPKKAKYLRYRCPDCNAAGAHPEDLPAPFCHVCQFKVTMVPEVKPAPIQKRDKPTTEVCRSPYCECEPGQCREGKLDKRGEPMPTAAPRPPLRDATVAERRAMRPSNYAALTPRQQWGVDQSLGLLDDDGLPAWQQPKGDVIAKLVNKIRDTAKVFHDSQQLRGRISAIVTAEMMPVNDTTLPMLRELRLWHWRQALYMREMAKQARSHVGEMNLLLDDRMLDSNADQHIKFVQLLNIFFQPDDTAEGDNK